MAVKMKTRQNQKNAGRYFSPKITSGGIIINIQQMLG
jgi:hypothetical protein